MNTILQTKNLNKIYYSEDSKKESTHALRGVDLSINEGDFTILMGPSGAGKSTLLNLLSALDTPTKGQVIYKGENIFSFPEGKLAKFRRESLGFIFQKLNLLEELSIRENIAVPLILNQTPKTEINSKVNQIAKKLGVFELLDKLPSECSGGQVQRIAIARALITEPKILIADEPTGNLDINNAEKLLVLLKKLNAEDNITVILVTHDPTIATYGKRIVFIEDGLIKSDIYSRDYNKVDYYTNIVSLMSEKEVVELESATSLEEDSDLLQLKNAYNKLTKEESDEFMNFFKRLYPTAFN